MSKEDNDLSIAMFSCLKYLSKKYNFLIVYEGCWRTMANYMCGNVEGRCQIMFDKKHWAYQNLRSNEKNK